MESQIQSVFDSFLNEIIGGMIIFVMMFITRFLNVNDKKEIMVAIQAETNAREKAITLEQNTREKALDRIEAIIGKNQDISNKKIDDISDKAAQMVNNTQTLISQYLLREREFDSFIDSTNRNFDKVEANNFEIIKLINASNSTNSKNV